MMRSNFKRFQHSLFAGLVFFGASALGLANAYAFGDEGGFIPVAIPSPIVVVPECKLGTGLFQVPLGLVDARSPLTVVGKTPQTMLSREFEAQDFVPIPYEDTSPPQVAKFQASVKEPNHFELMRASAAKAALAMIQTAQTDNILLRVHSGYRAYSIQCQVFNYKMMQEYKLPMNLELLAAGAPPPESQIIRSVNTRSALPGQSEHQLGTAMDIVTNTPGKEWLLEPEMDATPGFAWLKQNAYKFGFILSFPKGSAGPKDINPRTGYVYEPWHWRYVGVVPAGRYKTCEAKGMTTTEFLRALNANPKFVCAAAAAT